MHWILLPVSSPRLPEPEVDNGELYEGGEHEGHAETQPHVDGLQLNNNCNDFIERIVSQI